MNFRSLTSLLLLLLSAVMAAGKDTGDSAQASAVRLIKHTLGSGRLPSKVAKAIRELPIPYPGNATLLFRKNTRGYQFGDDDINSLHHTPRTGRYIVRNALTNMLYPKASPCTLRCLDWNNSVFRTECDPQDALCLCSAPLYNNDWTECMCDNCRGLEVREMLVQAVLQCHLSHSDYTIDLDIRVKLFDAIRRQHSPSGI